MQTSSASRCGGAWRARALLLCLGVALFLVLSDATLAPVAAALQPTASQAAEPAARAWYDRPMLTLLIALGGVGGIWLAVARQRALVDTLRIRVRELSDQLEGRSEALENAETTLKQLATHDAVTGLPNHGHFQDMLRAEWRRALREASPISVVMIDIDHFTEYNEEFGHQDGDDCLTKISVTLTEIIGRPGDLVARFGGEEFAVLLARTDQQGAFRVASKVREAIEEMKLPHPRSLASQHVTVSVGVASATPALDSNWEELELVAAANRAVEQAKTQGRNTIVS